MTLVYSDKAETLMYTFKTKSKIMKFLGRLN